MNSENTKKLYDDFPDLYKQHTWPMTQTCMCWNFECRDGWFQIIYDLSKALTELNQGVEAVQVKEKFGTLRFYANGYSKDVEYLIDKACGLSAKTCEVCGTTEKVTRNDADGYWIQTLCKKCRKENK